MRKPASLCAFKRVASRQEWKCKTCQNMLESTAQVDHVIPLRNGGTNDESNLQVLCVRCHAIKTQEEAVAKARYDPVARAMRCLVCKTYFSKYFEHRCSFVKRFFSGSHYTE